jgi:hypothetical protein
MAFDKLKTIESLWSLWNLVSEQLVKWGATAVAVAMLQIPVHRGQSFRRIADSIPVIADSF